MISVVIPCYNYAQYVGEAIQSVISQDYPYKEIIVVDDGSTDNSWEVITNFQDSVRTLKVINGGPLKACLAALELATGEYIYILDADDILIGPGALSTAAAALEKRPSKLQFPLLPVNAMGKAVSSAFPRFQEDYSTKQMIDEIRIRGSYLTPPTSGNIYRRDVFALAHEVDYEIWTDGVAYLASPFFGDVVTIRIPLALYRIHQSNQSMTAPLNAERLREERSRVHARLNHLRKILPPEMSGQIPRAETLFGSYQNIALEYVAIGKRPSSELIAAALKALFREQKSGIQRTFIASWLILLGVAPASIRMKLAMWRASSWNAPKIVQILKSKLR
jgi:glycosyltransferase involved in cell wall biosynthesis